MFPTLQVQRKVRERITARQTGKIEQEKPDDTWNPSPAETDEFVEQLEYIGMMYKCTLSSSFLLSFILCQHLVHVINNHL